MPMTPKIRRWIDLVAALLRRRYPISFEELAREVPGYQSEAQTQEARRRMFERDKKDLRSFGVPIETSDLGAGDLGYTLSAANFYLPYLQLLRDGRTTTPRRPNQYGYRSLPILTFEPDELAVVFQAGNRVEALGVPSLTEDAASALRKLGHDLPLDAVDSRDGVRRLQPRKPIDDEVFTGLSEALTRRKQVTFVYHSMDRDAVGERTVLPYGLFFLGHHWYLAAADHDGRSVKNYRLSRIEKLTVNSRVPGRPDYQIPEDFSLRDHAVARQSWELGSGDVTEVTVRVTNETGAALAAGRLGRPVSGDPGARRFEVRRLDVFARWILGAAGNVAPVSPPELVALYRDQVRRTLARYPEDRR